MVNNLATLILEAFKRGSKLLICGCGGSATQASHFAAEFVCQYKKKRQALPAIALNDIACITAIGNDFGFEYVFSRQVEALGNKGDVLIALSTSGKSKSVLNAISTARKKGMYIIDFTHLYKKNKNTDVAVTQELQVAAMHEICEKVEEGL